MSQPLDIYIDAPVTLGGFVRVSKTSQRLLDGQDQRERQSAGHPVRLEAAAVIAAPVAQ